MSERNSILAIQGICVNANAHGGQLKRDVQRGMVDENIAVERPIVVVGCASVVRLAAPQRTADAHDEHGTVLLDDVVFTLLVRRVGPAILQLLRGHEGDVLGK